MSVYLDSRRKTWRYDFQQNGNRYQGSGYATRKEAVSAMAAHKKRITMTRMGFLAMLNNRLDYIKAYHSDRHYTDNVYMSRRWARRWKDYDCEDITTADIEAYLIERKAASSPETANKDLRCLRALFNFGCHPKRKWLTENPCDGIDFFPESRRAKYIPSREDVIKVILAADPDTQDYLWTIALTLGRMSEINRLSWTDVDFQAETITLYSRKKSGGHNLPRRVVMLPRLIEIMKVRYVKRDKDQPLVFWHKFFSRKSGQWAAGRYTDRKRIMTGLCKKAGVKYFRFHALRHFGATMMEQSNVSIKSIQSILGHENRRTTEIYLHSLTGSEKSAMGVLDDVYSEKEKDKSHGGL